MQKLLYSLLVVSSLVLYSCQKEVDFATSNNNQVTGDFRAKIEGVQWVANNAAGATRLGGLINITGKSNDKKLITFTLKDSGVHNYTLNDISVNVGAYQDSTLPSVVAFSTNAGTNPGDAGGSISITSIDTTNKRMSGTFTIKVMRQIDGLQRTITEGSFTNLKYQTTLPPTGNATDTFKVKINGVSWTPYSVNGILVPGIPPALPPTLAINATDATASKTIGLVMPPTITPGTYAFSFFGTYMGVYNPDTDPNHSQMSDSGELIIISHNPTTKRIRGTFHFHCENLMPPLLSSDITEGYFHITYQ